MNEIYVDKLAIRNLWTMFHRNHGCSVDRVVCDPALRNEFLNAARRLCGTDDEYTILWTALNLRKAKALDAAIDSDTSRRGLDSIAVPVSDASRASFAPKVSGDETR